MSPALTHVALHVQDLDACVDFYERYCGLRLVHERGHGTERVIWLAETGREEELVFVLIANGKASVQASDDYGHLGFAVESRARVDEIAERGRREGILVWAPTDSPFPVGYYCGVRDPNGLTVEFSFGQPLGPGAKGPLGGADEP